MPARVGSARKTIDAPTQGCLAEMTCVEGGYLASPEVIPTRMHEGEKFIIVRQYDAWLYKYALPRKSRRRSVGDEFFEVITAATRACCVEEGEEEVQDDPLAAVSASIQKKRRKRRLATAAETMLIVSVPKHHGSTEQMTIRILKSSTSPQRVKSAFIHVDDFAWAAAYLLKEHAEESESAQDESKMGWQWLPGQAHWKCTCEKNGDTRIVYRRVHRTKMVKGETMALSPAEFIALRTSQALKLRNELLADGWTVAEVPDASETDDAGLRVPGIRTNAADRDDLKARGALHTMCFHVSYATFFLHHGTEAPLEGN